jgi:hypothetical protein
MADEKPSLHIDTDWKQQAQEEKRRLTEQEQQRKTAPAPAGVMPGSASAGPRGAAGPKGGAREPREMPPASFNTLMQSVVTQVLYYLGELSTRGGEPIINLDMAKHNIDTLTVLEEKTRNNLTPEEKQMMDASLYETRMRYVSVASRYAELP